MILCRSLATELWLAFLEWISMPSLAPAVRQYIPSRHARISSRNRYGEAMSLMSRATKLSTSLQRNEED